MIALSAFQWSKDCGFGIPSASINPHRYSRSINARYLRPVSERFNFSSRLKQSIPSGVIALLSRSGPPAIILRIISVVVNAVNGMVTTRALAHIRKESFKRFPCWGVSDPSATVVSPLMVFGVAAPSLHVSPTVVCPSAAISVGVSMAKTPIYGAFFVKAAAGYGFPTSETSDINIGGVSTRAYAVPIWFAVFVSGSAHYSPSPKSCSSKINKFSHDCSSYLTSNHSKLGLNQQETKGVENT